MPKYPLTLATLITAILPTQLNAQEDASKWSVDVSLYGLAPGMSGDVTAKGVNADLDVPFETIWNNLDLGAMGKVRVGYDRWALTTDVIYMGLKASKNGVSADLDQWVAEPSLSYRLIDEVEVLAGTRYNNISGEIRGPGILPQPRIATGSQDWWDPIVGANLNLPLGHNFSLNARMDIGGFGVGSDLTWQAFPYLSWRFTNWGSLQAGYRWVYTDYENGSGSNLFRYDVMTQGPQVGFTIHF